MNTHWLQSLLKPVQDDDSYQQFLNAVLHYTILISLILTSISFFANLPEVDVVPVFTYIVLFSTFALARTKNYKQAYAVYLAGSVGYVILATVRLNGLSNINLALFVMSIAYASIFYRSARAVILINSVAIGWLLILFYTQPMGILPLRTTEPMMFDRVLILSAVFIVTSVVLHNATRILTDKLALLRERETQLEKRNAQLEREIAEHNRTSQTLRASEERYAALFDNTDIMTTIANSEGKILRTNQAAASFINLTPQDIHDRNYHDFLDTDTANELITLINDVAKSGQKQIMEGKAHFQSGKMFYYIRQIVPLSVENNDSNRVLILTTDITDAKLAEQRATELAKAKERLQFFTEFFAQVSHDLKTPLAVMKTSKFLLTKMQDPARRAEKLDVIDVQIDVMQNYINDMLMISHLQHIPTITRQPIAFNQMIRAICQDLAPKVESKSHRLNLNLPPIEIKLVAMHDQLRRACANLIENAINYTPKSGTITIDVTKNANELILRIQDTGIGIPADDIPHIFNQFYRTQNAKTFLSSGTGLGLAIVRRIVELHDGTITVESDVHVGSTFTVTLPISLESIIASETQNHPQ